MFEHHTALGTFVGFQSGMTSLMGAESDAVGEMLATLLALENILERMGLHVLGDCHPKLKLPAAQRAVVRLIWKIVAAVTPELLDCCEALLTASACETPLLACVRLLIRTCKVLPLLFVCLSVFDETAAVHKCQITFFAGERCRVIVCMEVSVEVQGLSAIKPFPTVLALQPRLLTCPHCVQCIISLAVNPIADPLSSTSVHLEPVPWFVLFALFASTVLDLANLLSTRLRHIFSKFTGLHHRFGEVIRVL